MKMYAHGFALVLMLPAAAGVSAGEVDPADLPRGDSNGNGSVDISDASHLLNFLFTGGPEPPCRAAADANSSGILDLSDAVTILRYLFLGGVELQPLSEAERAGCTGPQVIRSGRFTTELHGVQGIAEQLSDRTIRLREFHYDGQGEPGVYVWLHRGGDLRQGYPAGPDLRIGFPGYTNATLVVAIPESVTDDMFHSVAIWCVSFDLNFGSARLSAN
ncbi:MAG TPA: DM13 domain-containing protein [Planctomycetota bacterium]|nr:DM13 domain-containing protein [Planctomycetota bacterium]